MNQLNLYHIFYTVAQCGNISAAAKKLYISQPAVSKSISKLEESFPTPLLQRTSKGVVLTESGQILYQQLETAFQAIKQGEEQIQQNNALGVGSISIGVSTTLCKYVLLPYLKTFIAANPNIKVSISCQSTYETLTALENGTLDIGLVGESERLGNLNFQPIQTIHDTLVTSPEYLEKLTEQAAQFYAKADITSAYERDVKCAYRSYYLTDDRKNAKIIDEIELKEQSEFYWFLHTEADIEVIENGAVLSKDGKKMKFVYESNQPLEIYTMDAVPLDTSPKAQNTPNDGVRKIVLYGKVCGNLKITAELKSVQ